MLRNLLITVAAIAAIGIINAGDAQAKMCDHHGTGAGMIYKAACATGGGGGGATIPVNNPGPTDPPPCDHETPEAPDPAP